MGKTSTYQTPGSAATGTTNAAAQGVNSATANQQALVNALQAQNGIQNQSNVYNQLQGVANGTGPNPAQAMLSQATGANTANQAALMAGQRGAGANSGLIARQAAQQGAANQEQAAGQGATLQANQSLNALGQAGNIAGQQVNNLDSATSGLTGAQLQNQGQQLGYQQGANQINAGVAQQNVNSQNQFAGQLIGGIAGGAGAALGLANGGEVVGMADGGLTMPQMGSQFGGQAPSLGVIPQASNSPTLGIQGLDSAVPQNGNIFGVSSMPGSDTSSSAQGRSGLQVAGNALSGFSSGFNGGAQSNVGKHLSQFAKGGKVAYAQGGSVAMAKGGKVPALVSPGERYLPPSEVKKVEAGKKDPMKAGEKIPGKRTAKGTTNSYADDIVPKTLEEGGIVLPNSVTQAKNPHWGAHKFVSEIMRKKGSLK